MGRLYIGKTSIYLEPLPELLLNELKEENKCGMGRSVGSNSMKNMDTKEQVCLQQ